MNINKVFLKSNVRIVPLLWKWYAWSYLIAPHTAALNILKRHIKIMESFLENPEIHYEASNNPNLIGGPFINLPENYVEQVQILLNWTYQNCAEYIEFAKNIDQTRNKLLQECKGQSLESYYEYLPKNLKGILELVYDLNDSVNIKFFEPLVYNKFYNNKAQSIYLEFINHNNNLSFILSTPYLGQSNGLNIEIPFSSPVIDKLSASRKYGINLEEVIEYLPQNLDTSAFKNFFCNEPANSVSNNNFLENSIRIRYFGHACILLETSKLSILIDPLIAYDSQTQSENFSFKDLPDKIDYLLISHNHQDHVVFESLLQLRHKVKHVIVPQNNTGMIQDPSLALIFERLGFQSIIESIEFKKISDLNMTITPVPFIGEHSDLDIRTKIGYHIVLNNHSFLFLIDSRNMDSSLYENTFRIIGRTDYIFLGMECVGAPMSWLYGPLFSNKITRNYDNQRRLSGSDFAKAQQIIQSTKCNNIFIYAMGLEQWLSHILTLNYNDNSPQLIEAKMLVDWCKQNNKNAEILFSKKELIIK